MENKTYQPTSLIEKITSSMPIFASKMTSEMLVLFRDAWKARAIKLCKVPYFRSPGKLGISVGEFHHDCQL